MISDGSGINITTTSSLATKNDRIIKALISRTKFIRKSIAGLAVASLLYFCQGIAEALVIHRHDQREISKNETIPEIALIRSWRTRQEILCVALVVYHETRGSTQGDMYGVANVVLNRKEHDRFPNSTCSVIYQKNQFAWTRNKSRRLSEKDSWIVSQRIAYVVYVNKDDRLDRTNGSLHFYNPKKIAKPKWAKNAKKAKRIGNHLYISKLLQ